MTIRKPLWLDKATRVYHEFGSTDVIPVTNISVMVGSTPVQPGTRGLVPDSEAGSDNRVLAASGLWVDNYVHPATHSADMVTETTDKLFMTAAERTKLTGVEALAKNYVHPTTHSADIVVDGVSNKVFTSAYQLKLDSIEVGAKNYVHPPVHSADMIVDGSTNLAFTRTIRDQIVNAEVKAEKGAALGYAPLDSGTKLLVQHFPISLASGVSYKGVWNSDTDSPTLTSTTPANGTLYLVGTPTTTPRFGTVWNSGDAIVYGSDYGWQRIPNDQVVLSVCSKTGIVNLVQSDIGGLHTTDIPTFAGINISGTGTVDGRDLSADGLKLDGMEDGANNYVHPVSHSADIVLESNTKKWFTQAERTKLNGIQDGAIAYVHPQTHSLDVITEGVTTTNRLFSATDKAKLAVAETTTNKNVAGGYAGIGVDGKLDYTLIPTGIVNGLTYKGTWNAATNNPAINSGQGTNGWFYRVAVAGTYNVDGTSSWTSGDWIIYNGSQWQRVPSVESVSSVNDKTGFVVLVKEDISGLKSTDNVTFANATLTGNVNVGGTVDGRDVSVDGQKLDGIEAQANKYVLPAATSSTLGGIIVGQDFTVSQSGVLGLAQITTGDFASNAFSVFDSAVPAKKLMFDVSHLTAVRHIVMSDADVDLRVTGTFINRSETTSFTRTILDDIDAAAVRTTIDAAQTAHVHVVSDITGVLPVNKGGTGAADAATARANLGILPVAESSYSLVARETMVAGSLVYFDETLNGIKYATNDAVLGAKKALGFINDDVVSGSSVITYFAGLMITSRVSLVPGRRYYLGQAGLPTDVAPTTTGNTLQFIGIAVTTNRIVWFPEDGYIL